MFKVVIIITDQKVEIKKIVFEQKNIFCNKNNNQELGKTINSYKYVTLTKSYITKISFGSKK